MVVIIGMTDIDATSDHGTATITTFPASDYYELLFKNTLRQSPVPPDRNDSQWNTKVCLSKFEPISKLIRDSPNQSYSLDPIPTPLLIYHYQMERCVMIIRTQCSFRY